MKTKTPLDYEVESSTFKRKLESCRFFSVWVTGFLVGLILLLSAMLVLCNTAHATEVGFSVARVHTKTQWVPIGGTVDFREAGDKIQAVSLSQRRRLIDWMDGRASITLFSPFSQNMIGRDASGQPDQRHVTTQAAVIGLTVEPHVGPFYVRYGTGLGLFDQRLRYLRDGIYRSKNEFQTGMVGITGVGFRSGGWSVGYDKYTDMVFRNSDLGGFNQRRERRHVELYTISYERRF